MYKQTHIHTISADISKIFLCRCCFYFVSCTELLYTAFWGEKATMKSGNRFKYILVLNFYCKSELRFVLVVMKIFDLKTDFLIPKAHTTILKKSILGYAETQNNGDIYAKNIQWSVWVFILFNSYSLQKFIFSAGRKTALKLVHKTVRRMCRGLVFLLL